MPKKRDHEFLQQEFERRILHGLSLEWEQAILNLPVRLRHRLRRPLFRLDDSQKRLGQWHPKRREISLNREMAMTAGWDSIVEVLHHEMAHQVAHELFRAVNEPPHGRSFLRACDMLKANPRASGTFSTLRDRLASETLTEEDKIFQKIQKLLSLAQSRNQNEAEAAMLKAHELMAKHRIDLISGRNKRNYMSIFIGKPALRHFREAYAMANLLQDFYFVEGIWVPAYVMEKDKMGTVLEISGAVHHVKMADYVRDFVNGFVNRKWEAYRAEHPTRRLNRYRKTDFALGILAGFRSKLEAGQVTSTPGVSTQNALVKLEDPGLKAYVADRYPRLRTKRTKALNQDMRVMNDGIREGKKLVIAKGLEESGESGKFLPDK